jgi:hypothetical protein
MSRAAIKAVVVRLVAALCMQWAGPSGAGPVEGGATAIAMIQAELGAEPEDTPIGARLAPVTKFVFANKKTLLQGWTEYNTGTCKVIDPGKTTAQPAPKYGSPSYSIETFTLSSGPCAGKSFPFSTTHYTWTDTKTTAPSDIFTLQWRSKDYSDDTQYTIKLGPRIFFKGADVTNKTVKVASGDKIALTTQPVVAGQSQSWDIPDEYVGGYTPKPGSFAVGKVENADLSGNKATVYWIDDGTKQVTYTMTAPKLGTGTGKTKFEVIGPTGVAANRVLGSIFIYKNSSLTFGEIVKPYIPGITFNRTAGSSGMPGHFLWVQLTELWKFTYVSLATGRHDCTRLTGLDNLYPYPGTDVSTSDSPDAALRQTWSGVTRDFGAHMFLMWQSDEADSIPVPQGSISWGFTAAATRNPKSGVWSLTRSSKSAGSYTPSSSFPLWTHVSTNATQKCN